MDNIVSERVGSVSDISHLYSTTSGAVTIDTIALDVDN